MSGFQENFNIEACSDDELLAFIRRTMPVVSVFLQATQKLLGTEKQPDSPCLHCHERRTCTKEYCGRLESEIPSPLSGDSNLSHTLGDMMDQLTADEISGNTKPVKYPLPDAEFNLYENCWPDLSIEQKKIVFMRLKLGMRNIEIASELNISPKAVSCTFARAKDKMLKHYRR